MHELTMEFAQSMAAVGEDQTDLLEALCRAAEAELAGMLRRDLTPQDCGEAFPLAAACLARAGLCAAQDADELPASWKAGAVSVSSSASYGERAAGLREQALRLLAPFLEDRAFFFRGVRG